MGSKLLQGGSKRGLCRGLSSVKGDTWRLDYASYELLSILGLLPPVVSGFIGEITKNIGVI